MTTLLYILIGIIIGWLTKVPWLRKYHKELKDDIASVKRVGEWATERLDKLKEETEGPAIEWLKITFPGYAEHQYLECLKICNVDNFHNYEVAWNSGVVTAYHYHDVFVIKAERYFKNKKP